MYIHERDNWTAFRWKADELTALLEDVNRKQGLLYGRLASLGFDSKLKAMAENLTHDVVYSSEIEGIRLNADEVRSSIARKLGMENIRQVAPSHYIDSVVAVMLDAVNHYDQPLTKEKICAWQAAFFPTGFSEGSPIEVGQYRTNEEHIVSGMFGREKIHYIAPSPERVDEEMAHFLDWFNRQENVNSVIRSAIAHFWFVCIHPFDDGNGRIGRAIADMALSQAENSKMRFFSISHQINKDKKQYYNILEKTQKGDCEITEWIIWYLDCLLRSIEQSDETLSKVLNKAIFWQTHAETVLSERQREVLNLYLDGYPGKLTVKNWAKRVKVSPDTAARDIKDLVEKGILIPQQGRVRDVFYGIRCSESVLVVPMPEDL